MVKIESLTSNNLSFYRTLHNFDRFGEINSVDDFNEYYNWAKANNAKLYILGNGSNTLFTKKDVASLVLKNNLPKHMKLTPDFRLEVSSSVPLIDVLKCCYENSLDSFYYLSSVPATIGGALAMNAGRGRRHKCTVYDFVEKVTFFEDGLIKTLTNEEIKKGYRETIFTGTHARLILSAVFKFNLIKLEYNPLIERHQFAKEHQDNTGPNCGTVFKTANDQILDLMKGVRIGKAYFSGKTRNWILNRSKSSTPIILLISLTKMLHLVTGKKIELEVIKVD